MMQIGGKITWFLVLGVHLTLVLNLSNFGLTGNSSEAGSMRSPSGSFVNSILFILFWARLMRLTLVNFE